MTLKFKIQSVIRLRPKPAKGAKKAAFVLQLKNIDFSRDKI